jgi:hypothetical protein
VIFHSSHSGPQNDQEDIRILPDSSREVSRQQQVAFHEALDLARGFAPVVALAGVLAEVFAEASAEVLVGASIEVFPIEYGSYVKN